MEDYFNDIDQAYHPADLEKLRDIREKLVNLRRLKKKFGPERVEIETIDSPVHQTMGVVFQKGLEVLIKSTNGQLEVYLLKPLNDEVHQAFTQSVLISISD
ncbi:hypothetical protein ACFPMF_15620 [Larkinella bovis]|uniref:Uncharacterized protein n=1 Tax=Larkinella bovis TaxID=683041 RepID=A0ABW0IBV2_9BACT